MIKSKNKTSCYLSITIIKAPIRKTKKRCGLQYRKEKSISETGIPNLPLLPFILQFNFVTVYSYSYASAIARRSPMKCPDGPGSELLYIQEKQLEQPLLRRVLKKPRWEREERVIY